MWYLLHMKIIRPKKGDYRLKGSICSRTLTLGMTSFLSQISLVAAMAAINNMIRKYGALDAVFGQEQYAQIPMAVVGIVMKFFQIVISIVVGMEMCIRDSLWMNWKQKKRRDRSHAKSAPLRELLQILFYGNSALGNSLLYISLLFVAFGRVRPGGRTLFLFCLIFPCSAVLFSLPTDCKRRPLLPTPRTQTTLFRCPWCG